MGKIKVTPCDIKGLYVIEPTIFKDERGYFVETYNQNDFKEAGLDMVFVQDNQSMSVKGVLRGLHYQKQYPQGKLVRAIRGTVFDVAVDLRADSETYGKWFGVVLSAENKKQFYIPEGFAHGFLVLSDEAEFAYKCTDFYHPGDEGGLAWNDPEIGVEWPIEEGMELIISEKDQKWGGFKDTSVFNVKSGHGGKRMNYYTSLFKGIIEKRKLIWDLSKADFKKRFVGSYFGVIWMFIQPLVTILIYAFLFGEYGFKSPPPGSGSILCHLDGAWNCALVLLQRGFKYRDKLSAGISLPGKEGSFSGGKCSLLLK